MKLRLRCVLTLVLFASWAMPSNARQGNRGTAVAKVYVAENGRVHIVDAEGRETVVPAEKDQAGSSLPKVSPDHRTAGWAVEYMTAGQTYPIPLVLAIYRSGKVVRRFHDELMIWDWQFRNNGRHVVLVSGPTHRGSSPAHYQLRNTATGRLLAEYWSASGKGPIPKWVQGLHHEANQQF